MSEARDEWRLSLLEQKQDKESTQSNGHNLFVTGSSAVQMDLRMIEQEREVDCALCVQRSKLAHE